MKEAFEECPSCGRTVRVNRATKEFLPHSPKKQGKRKDCPGRAKAVMAKKSIPARAAFQVEGLPSLPAARVAAERESMVSRLEDRGAAAHLRERALVELRERLCTWWAIPLPLPNLTTRNVSTVEWGASRLPIVLERDPLEELILRVLAPVEPARYGVTEDGAIYTFDRNHSHCIFIGYLSPLLERVVRLFKVIVGCSQSHFWAEDGAFFADYGGTGEFRPFAVVGSERVSAVADRCLDALGYPEFRQDPLNGLVVNYRDGWPDKGVLSEMGYHVGINGLRREERRRILRHVVSAVLIEITGRATNEVRAWGGPRSEQRVTKIANCLASFASQARSRRADMGQAIADWEEDLRWLRKTYGR